MEDDSLVQSSFVVPCSNINEAANRIKKGKTRALDDDLCFPLIAYEKDDRGAQWRQRGYEKSLQAVQSAFDRVHALFHQMLLKNLENLVKIQDTEPQFYIPGPSRLTVACIDALPVAETLSKNLSAAVRERYGNVPWVHLHPRECLDLATTLRIITARALHSRNDLDFDKMEFSDLSSIRKAKSDDLENRIHIFIDHFALFHHGVFNDLIQSLNYIMQMKAGLQFIIILSTEVGRASLDDKIDPNISSMINVHIFDSIPPTLFFEKVMEELFLETIEKDGLHIWPGDKVLELTRKQFYEKRANLKQMQAMFEVSQ